MVERFDGEFDEKFLWLIYPNGQVPEKNLYYRFASGGIKPEAESFIQ